MLNRLVWALAPLALLPLGGCNSLASGPVRDRPEAFSAAAFKLDPSWSVLNGATDWEKIPFGSRKAARNEFVTARMYLIDRAYYDFESTMLQDTRTGGFLGDLFVSALTSGAAIIDDNQIQQGMAAAATAVVGGRQAFDKQVLMDRTIQTLQNQMRASRADVKARILERLKFEYEDWPIGLAQSDVEEYYQAGTLVSALTAASDSASARKLVEEEQADQVLTASYQTEGYTAALRAYLDVDDETEFARRNKIFVDQLKAVYITQDPATFTEFNQDKRLKKQILDALIAADTNQVAKDELIALRNKARENEQ